MIDAIPMMIPDDRYRINNSLLFRPEASASLSRTPAVAGNRRLWTFSTWFRRSSFVSGRSYALFDGGTSNDNVSTLWLRVLNTSDTIGWVQTSGGAVIAQKQTSVVLRDPGGWYHVVVVYDSDNPIGEDRLRIYLNGIRVTGWTADANTNPPLGLDSLIGGSWPHHLGRTTYSSPGYFDGYLAETVFLDGIAAIPSDFGVFIPGGAWQPRRYTGLYGAQGWFLQYQNPAAPGADASGNGNHWTPAGLTAADQMLDTPTQVYAILSPIHRSPGMSYVPSNGGLTLVDPDISNGRVLATTPASSGRWYWEVVPKMAVWAGLASTATALPPGADATSWSYRTDSGKTYWNGIYTSLPAVFNRTTDVLNIAWDADAGRLWFGRNGVWLGGGDPVSGVNPALTGVTGTLYPCVNHICDVSFGQRPWAYPPPAGYQGWTTEALPPAQPLASGTFSGNANADGPVIYTGGAPETLMINGQPVTWGTHADRLVNGFKLRTSAAAYNGIGTNAWAATHSMPAVTGGSRAPAPAQIN